MKSVCLVVVGVLFLLAASVSPAGATAITCEATLDSGQGSQFFSATLDPAISCVGPAVGNNVYPSSLSEFGETWIAQDKDETGGESPTPGVTEGALTVTGLNTNGGIITINPLETQCGAVDCNFFVIGLKWDGVIAYWNIGSATSITWSSTPNALSNLALYGRFGDEGDVEVNAAPEPTSILLLATGLVAAGVRRYRHRR
jgi:hypothetical protein